MKNDTKICPFCGEKIKAIAIKCKFCGKMLNAEDEQTPKYITNADEFKELGKFNWGAFFLTWLWAIFNKAYIGLIALPLWLIVTYSNNDIIFDIFFLILILFGLWFGKNANKIAYQNNNWCSLQTFKEVQNKWLIGGLIYQTIDLIRGIIEELPE